VTPIFMVSSVTGENLDLLVKFLNLLPARSGRFLNPEVDYGDLLDRDPIFHIEEIFSVPSKHFCICVGVDAFTRRGCCCRWLLGCRTVVVL